MARHEESAKTITLEGYKADAITAAKELGYGSHVMHLINKAKSISEVERILVDARHGKYEEV